MLDPSRADNSARIADYWTPWMIETLSLMYVQKNVCVSRFIFISYFCLQVSWPQSKALIATAQSGAKRMCIDGKQSGSESRQIILGSHLWIKPKSHRLTSLLRTNTLRRMQSFFFFSVPTLTAPPSFHMQEHNLHSRDASALSSFLSGQTQCAFFLI